VTIGLCLLYLTGLLANLPSVVLAAIVLVAVKGLINVKELRHVWRVSRFEFAVSMVALAAVLLLGILRGVIVAVLVSLLLLIRRAARPHVAFLGRIPGTRDYSDMERHPDNEPVPGALVVRVEASLVYFNVEHVRDTLWEKLYVAREAPALVVFDLSASPSVDLAGARMLATLHSELTAAGIRLRLVDARASVRDILRAEGLEPLVGDFGRGTSVALAVEELQATRGVHATSHEVSGTWDG
jgi:sulfate permease, SulP family